MPPLKRGVVNLARVQRKATKKIKEVKKRDLKAKSQGAGKIHPGEEKVKEITDFMDGQTEERGLNRQHGRILVKYKEFHDMRNGK